MSASDTLSSLGRCQHLESVLEKKMLAYPDLVQEPFKISPTRSILSVDVEEYFNFVPRADESIDTARLPKRSHVTLPQLLELFEEQGVRATFFILASVLDNLESSLKRIVDGGHEVACHGWSHQRVHQMTPAEFRNDLVQSRERIESATAVRPVGYRAPSFSMSRDTLWAFDILKDEGFEYDSSVAPLSNSHYGGLPNAPFHPHRLRNGIIEFPMPTYRVGPLRTLVGGGFYLRLFPLWLNRFFLWRFRRRHKSAPVLYIHPWEIDETRYNVWDLGVDHPALEKNARFLRWTNVFNRDRALPRLRRLIETTSCASFAEVLS